MSTLLTTKVAGIICGIAGISTIGVGITYLSLGKTEKEEENKSNSKVTTSKAVSKWLEEEEDVVLMSKQETEGNPWETTWSTFKANYDSEQLSENWKSLESKKSDPSVPEEFKTACETNSGQVVESKDAKIYKEVKKYCTKTKVKPG